MACNTLTKAHFISEQLSSLRCMYCLETRMVEQVFRAKFVPLSAHSMVAVVQRKGVSRKIAWSTALCKWINRSSTGSQWSVFQTRGLNGI